jgi:general secretion pathway protein A
MYRNFFNMAKDAFAINPSPDDYFGSKSHDQALHLLVECVGQGEPYILVTGEYGVGKTLLCLKLCQYLESDPGLLAVTVSTPSAPFGLLLRSIAVQLEITGITSACKTVAEFEATLFNLYISGKLLKSIYLIIDDLQDYEQQMLLRFKHLANFHVRNFYPFRLICFSHPGYIEELEKNPHFVPFLQRFRRRLNILPLQEDELKEYIYFRLLRAGAKGRPLFDDESLLGIADISGRIPRLVNNLCDRLLLRASELMADRIDFEMVRDVCRIDEYGRIPPDMEDTQSILKERVDVKKAKAIGAGINLDTVGIDNGTEEEENNETFFPVSWISWKHLRLSAMIVGAVILVMSLIFLWGRPQGSGNPALSKDTDHQSQSGRNESRDYASNAVATAKGNEEAEKREDRFKNQVQGITVGENNPDRRIAIHQLTTTDSMMTQPIIFPGEKPYTLEVFSGSTPSVIEIELKRLRDQGLAPLFISETGTDRMVTGWNICLGSFSSKEDAQKSSWLGKAPEAQVRYLPYTLLLSLSTKEESMNELQKTLEIDGYHPWLERLEKGQYRLLMGAYPSKIEAQSRARDLREEGIVAAVVRR